jgi:hypothetical protein
MWEISKTMICSRFLFERLFSFARIAAGKKGGEKIKAFPRLIQAKL